MISLREQQPIRIEVRTIWHPPPMRRFGYHDPHAPIRSHIEAGRDKFAELKDGINIIALVRFPASFVDLNEAHVMLGAMNGDLGFEIPVGLERGMADPTRVTQTFIRGRGLMVRPSELRNTRISALLTVNDTEPYFSLRATQGLSLGEHARLVLESFEATESAPCVTVWDNAVASVKIPPTLFAGPKDVHWKYDGEEYVRLSTEQDASA